VARRRTARRAQLLADIDREGRRTGSLGALHGRAIAERVGMHPTDFECLDVLDWTGPIAAGELARRVGLTSGAITGVIDRLERGGWVRRASDPADRRRVIVEMLPEPPADRREDMLRSFLPLIGEMNEINERYDEDQLDAIADWLRRANDAVERSTARLRQP
jgi:DNA-binding MarR family transcriptional regulator